MPELSMDQYSLVYNMFSLTIACMLASFAFFIFAKERVAPRYRISLIVSALVVGIAGYHYFRIADSWDKAYDLVNGVYVASGVPFNDAYRYVDWLLTVPLLMVELVLVMGLSGALTKSLLARLTTAAFLMIALGYPGEVLPADAKTSMMSMYGLWGFLSTIPFCYILYVLWVELGKTMNQQPPKVRVLLRNIRLLTLATWGFYPIAYMGPFIGFGSGAGGEVFVQVGYTIADILAKCGYGVMIYNIARAKTEAMQEAGELESEAATTA